MITNSYFELSHEVRKNLQARGGNYLHDRAVVLLALVNEVSYALDLLRACNYGKDFNEAVASTLRAGVKEQIEKSTRPEFRDQAGVWNAVADLFDPTGGEMPKLSAELERMRAELIANGYESDPDKALAALWTHPAWHKSQSQNETGENSQEI